VVVKDGSLFTVNQTSLGMFDSLKELPVETDVLEPLLEEEIATGSTDSVVDMAIAGIPTDQNSLDADFSSTKFVKEITIVVGAFASKKNAEKLLARLISDGFDAKSLGENELGLTRVALVTAGNKIDNDSFMQKVRAEVSADAWILD
jgi:hypothetical protein